MNYLTKQACHVSKSAALAVTLSLMSIGAHAEIAVVVNPANVAVIDQAQVKSLFTGKSKSFSDGSSAVLLSYSGATTDEFNQKVLGRSSSQIKALWSKLVFSGKAKPPKKKSTGAEVKAAVATNADMIGYIDASLVDDSVKVLFKL